MAVVLFLVGVISLLWLKKTPTLIAGLTEYLNLKPATKKPTEIFVYAKLLNMFPEINWRYFFNGKRAGKDVYFGVFYSNKQEYCFFSIKDEVKPMLVSDNDLGDIYQEKTKLENLHIYAKDRYMLENIEKSDQFILDTQYLFMGRNNYLEFTDLNQVILITDYKFTNIKEMLEFFAKFSHIKEHL